jgi:ATP-binding cassette subfamily B protein
LEDPDVPQEERERRFKEHRLKSDTVVIAFCTNAKKRKLFAFLDILRRLQRGENVTEADGIFDQFRLRCPKCGKIYADQNRKICTDCVNNSAVMLRLFKYLKDYKGSIAIVLFVMLATSGISLVSPLISGLFLYDNIIAEDGAFHHLGVYMVWIAIAIIFGTSLFSTCIDIVKNRIFAQMSTGLTLDMKIDIFSAMQKLSLSYFNANQTGRLMTRVNYDADVIRGFFIGQVPAVPLFANDIIHRHCTASFAKAKGNRSPKVVSI